MSNTDIIIHDEKDNVGVVVIEKITKNQIQNGEKPIPGSYRGRKNSEPENNRKTLLNIKNA